MVKLEVNLTNRWLYTVLLAIVLLVVGGIVYAYNSGAAPSVMGHSGEEIEVTVDGATKTLNEALLGNSMSFEIKNPDITTYECVTKDLKDYCGDEDGCRLKLLMQHETLGDDQVRVIEETIYMEGSLSNNNGAGVYGWTRQLGGGEASWITGTAGQHSMFTAWDWIWMFNYRHDFCPGQSGNSPAYSYPYNFTIMVNPQVSAKIIVYD